MDVAFADSDSLPSQALARHQVRVGRDAPDAVRDAELVISAVTADQDLAAATQVGPGLPRRAMFLDLNSCAPGQKVASAAAVEAAGGRYVEAAVMSPIGPKRIASPMLLGGLHAADFVAGALPLGFTGAAPYSDVIGQAAATKLCRSVMIKGRRGAAGRGPAGRPPLRVGNRWCWTRSPTSCPPPTGTRRRST